MKDLLIIQEKLRDVINNILDCKDNDVIINYMPVYNNYFCQFVEIINDQKGILTQKEKELVVEVLNLNKTLKNFFESKKSELEKIISKKGLKRKILDVYNPYFKGDFFIKDV